MLIELGGYDVESGIGPWDPLNLATVTGDAMDVGARCELPLDPRVRRSLKAELTPCSRHALCRLRWYRQAEIKHGRVSMAAFVGWIVSQNGLSWPGIEKAWVGTRVDMWPKSAAAVFYFRAVCTWFWYASLLWPPAHPACPSWCRPACLGQGSTGRAPCAYQPWACRTYRVPYRGPTGEHQPSRDLEQHP